MVFTWSVSRMWCCWAGFLYVYILAMLLRRLTHRVKLRMAFSGVLGVEESCGYARHSDHVPGQEAYLSRCPPPAHSHPPTVPQGEGAPQMRDFVRRRIWKRSRVTWALAQELAASGAASAAAASTAAPAQAVLPAEDHTSPVQESRVQVQPVDVVV